MDPNYFFIDWPRVVEVLAAVVLMSFIIERALALVFESRLFIDNAKEKGIKEPIALVVGIVVCWFWHFDAVSVIFIQKSVTVPGVILTGAVVAGGSKGSLKLFRDVLKFKSTAEKNRQEIAEEKQKLELKRAKENSGGQGGGN